MTQEEIAVFKQSILDAIESYVNIKLSDLPTMKSDIGIVLGEGTRQGNKVKIRDAEYDNILSVGNIVFPTNSIVYTLAPNGQYNQLFILGQLSDTPANIVGGTIDIGKGNFTVDDNGNVQIKSGSINLANKFIVDTNGKVSILDGSININGNFEVTEDGSVTIKNGSINLGNNNFTVDNNGNVQIKNGSINLGNGNFIVNENGSVTIKNGSINLGNGVFIVDTDGKVTANNLNINGGGITLNNGKFVVTNEGVLTIKDNYDRDSVQLSPNFGLRAGMKDYGSYVEVSREGISASRYYANNQEYLGCPFIINSGAIVGGSYTTEELEKYLRNNGEPLQIIDKLGNIDALVIYAESVGDRTHFITHITQNTSYNTQGIQFDVPVYNSNGGVVFTSDLNAKNNVHSLDIKESADFILSQNPVEYKFNEGTSGRYHHGFIAQEVKEKMGDRDWGVYVDNGANAVSKGLRYDEFIADLVATCQYQQKEIEELKDRLNKIEDSKNNNLEVNDNVNDNTNSR